MIRRWRRGTIAIGLACAVALAVGCNNGGGSGGTAAPGGSVQAPASPATQSQAPGGY